MKKHNKEGKKRRKREKKHMQRVKVGKVQEHPLKLLIGGGETPVEAVENLQPDTENILIESTKMKTGIVLRRASDANK